MEKIIERNILFDYYGDLLTERQRSIYQDAVYGDLSLSELADDYGISRQGVHDQLKKCDKALEGYEQKLKLIEKSEQIKKYMDSLLYEVKSAGDDELTDRVSDLITRIKEEL